MGLFVTLSIKASNANTLSVVEVVFFCYAEYHYAECLYTECHYAECLYTECHYAECLYTECHYAECHGAASKAFQGGHVSFLASSSLTKKRHFKE
jgi:hypothetical protein